MLILVNGLPFFSKKIVADLNQMDASNRYLFVNTYESRLAQLKFVLLLPFSGAIISFNGVSSHSKSMDWVIRFRKKLIMQWHGTDVQLATERVSNGTIIKKYIAASIHLTSAPWFQEELVEVVEKSTYAPFGYVCTAGNDTKYSEISILTYFAKGKENFYGWSEIEYLAKKMPQLKIRIVGVKELKDDVPNNIEMLGWVSEDRLLELMKESSIFVRLTEHDGKAISVSQALSTGAEVIWTYPFEKCHLVPKKKEALLEKVIELKHLIEQREMMPNKENIWHAEQTLLREPVLRNYLSILKSKLHA